MNTFFWGETCPPHEQLMVLCNHGNLCVCSSKNPAPSKMLPLLILYSGIFLQHGICSFCITGISDLIITK